MPEGMFSTWRLRHEGRSHRGRSAPACQPSVGWQARIGDATPFVVKKLQRGSSLPASLPASLGRPTKRPPAAAMNVVWALRVPPAGTLNVARPVDLVPGWTDA